MRIRVLVALVVLATALGCSMALRRTAQASEVLAYGSLACDMNGTHVALQARYAENNPFLGEFPSTEQLGFYFGNVAAGVFGLNRIATAAFGDEDVASVARIVLNSTVLAVQVKALEWNAGQRVSLCGM